ncbi:MAG: VWA domain-containing protein [Polyangiaceae bacterium]|nr:VWA domain-containing protein [Polyangiaceae bacterium]
MSLVRAGLLVGLVGGLAALPIGCSDDGGLDAAGFDGGNGGVGGVATGPCETGDNRKCGIKLAQHDDIVTCYVGTQSCTAGKWGECTDGSQITKSVAAPPGIGPGSGSMNFLGNCANNPCDPYCQNYNNDAGYSADGGSPIYTWQGGQITGMPNGLVNKGLVQPCASGSDCQFNTYCWHPKTTASCAHSKCQTGGKLAWSCDPCVKDICKADPTCCTYPDTVPNGGTCDHSICTAVGGNSKLAKGCDQNGEDCTTTICNSPGLDYCCKNNNSWDAACVAAVATKCGLNCANLNGAGTWVQACVDKVATACDATCGVGAPPPEEGKCKEWIPGQTDPTCPGIDLAGDVPCAGNTPICNHGQGQAPAGIRIVHYPANSNQYPKCAPGDHANLEECFTTKVIKPGECTTDLQYWDGSAWKPGCPGLTGNGNREVMINPPASTEGSPARPKPPGYAGPVAECSCKDNWTLYSGGTCGLPTCGGDSQVATFKKVNYIIQMDRTQSMINSGIWAPAVAGMQAFFQNGANAGLGLALECFGLNNVAPFGDGCAAAGGSGNCLAAGCSNPYIPLGYLTAGAAPGDVQEGKLVTGIANCNPNGGGGSGFGTRIYPALDGALQWAANQLVINPNEKFDVVLLTDGDPTDCDINVANIAALASTALSTKGIKTHVIAMPGSTTAFLDAIAAAGGTTSSIVVNNGTVAADIQAGLSAIAGSGITCSSDLPAANLYDQSNVKVVFTPSSGAPVNLPKRADLAACNGNVNAGWYYDSNAAPTKILLCPKSCTTAQTDAGSKIDITLGCPTGAGPVTVTLDHQGQCPPGSKPVWNFFSYDTTTPNTSTVTFRVRTADTQAGLSSAGWHNLAVAQSVPTDTQVCPLTGPAPCPVDAFAALGFPDQKRAWAQLELALVPGGGGIPTVNTFNLTYSCPPSE